MIPLCAQSKHVYIMPGNLIKMSYMFFMTIGLTNNDDDACVLGISLSKTCKTSMHFFSGMTKYALRQTAVGYKKVI